MATAAKSSNIHTVCLSNASPPNAATKVAKCVR